MQNEKLAVIGLVIIIVVALSAFILLQPNEDGTGTILDDILRNLFGEEAETAENIEVGDCVDVHYTGSFENGTIFGTSYADIANQSGIYDPTRSYEPLNIFASLNATEFPPEGYETYSQYVGDVYIEGFMEGLIGLKEGETATIGPIPPEKAYGVYPKVGDEIIVYDAEIQKNLTLVFVAIEENASMPEEYVSQYGNVTTILFTLRYEYFSVGEIVTPSSYPTWENATVVTKINETMVWIYTTPPEDKLENFTWIELDPYAGEISYWENASSVTTLNDTTIIVTHSPEINATFDYFGTTYTAVGINDTKINVSFDDGTGNITDSSLDRTVTIERNQSQQITSTHPEPYIEQLLQLIKLYYLPDLTLGVHELAGETLIFEVEIMEVYKTSQQES